ncbi:M-phase phosphoprotein 6-like isoform X2 [Clytia hemisphaerica]|uniref:M-phase phosphoprotein 6-like isoform X2 n=1 Tax=Clytia hemisphaerica TaxID=252671 RepID=UPI0034D3DA51
MASERCAEDSATRRSLSKNVMQMKFMIRGKDQGEEISEKKNKKNNESEWVIGGIDRQTKKVPYTFDVSYMECEELIPYGRMSYLNFNPVVQKKHHELLQEANMALSGEREEFDGVSDEEMAHRYESLVGTVGKKFQTKRKRKAIEEELSQSDGTEPEEDTIEKRAKRGFVKPRVSPKDEFEF